MSDPKKSLETRPKHVALVALGPSYYDFIREAVGRKDHAVPFDEIWTVNRGFQAFRHDKVFVMDDLRWLEQRDFGYAEALKRHDKPLITCFAYDDYPMSIAYPLDMILRRLEDDLLNNTVAYAIAYAMMTNVECLSVYGADFYYPDVQMREEGSQACALLLGMARSFGMKFRLPQSTTLLGAHTVKIDPTTGQSCRPLYGYHRRVQLQDPPEHAFSKYIKEIQASPDDVGRHSLVFGPREAQVDKASIERHMTVGELHVSLPTFTEKLGKEDARTRTPEGSRTQDDIRDKPSPAGIHEPISQVVHGGRPSDLREGRPVMVGGGEQGEGRAGLVLDGSGKGDLPEGPGRDGTGPGTGPFSLAELSRVIARDTRGDGEDKEARPAQGEIHPEEEVNQGLADVD